MQPLFGMAGIGEAATAMALMIGYVGLIFVFFAAITGLMSASRAAAGTALVVVGGLTLLFMPWEAFPHSNPRIRTSTFGHLNSKYSPIGGELWFSAS